DPPNLLLMDEPTTHLDMASIDALIHALEDYNGTLVFISHDVYFIRKIARSVLRISAGELTPYAGDYDYYLRKSESQDARAALTAGRRLSNDRPADLPASNKTTNPSGSNFKSKEQKRAEAAVRQAKAKVRTEVDALEARILKLEAKQQDLTAQLEDPELYAGDTTRMMKLNRELLATVDELETANAAWLEASERLEG
ncbi:MAG: ABC transporter ATP-binding protein, partial [Verrucomicrobiota bacterium]